MRRSEWLLLLVGDFVLLFLSLPVALFVRSFSIPDFSYISLHFFPFAILTAVSLGVFFASGLYDVQTTIFKRELPRTIVATQVVNVLLAALLFFFVDFGIAPKTNLLSYLVISSLFVILWRLFGVSLFLKERPHGAMVVIGDGEDAVLLSQECDQNSFYPFSCGMPMTLLGKSPERIREDMEEVLATRPALIVLDPQDSRLEEVFPMVLEYVLVHKATFIDFNVLFEQMFRRVALSNLRHTWFLTDAIRRDQIVYTIFKRTFDIIIALIIAVIICIITPFLYFLQKLEGKGPLFIVQDRVGKDMAPIHVHKFRTMRTNKTASQEWTVEEKTDNPITKLGAFLRHTSIDELPQIFGIIRGDLSFIGPRSDIQGLAERLKVEIPFYNARYLITPGISGWAQVNQRYAPGNISPQSIEESRIRLAYDLYYVKHRSLSLDISIALRTIKTLLVRLIPKKSPTHGNTSATS